MNNNDDFEHHFKTARRGSAIASKGKTRVTMYLDDDVLEHFRKHASHIGRGYQTEINACLRRAITQSHSDLTRESGVATTNVCITGSFRSVSPSKISSAGGMFVVKEKSMRRKNQMAYETSVLNRLGMQT